MSVAVMHASWSGRLLDGILAQLPQAAIVYATQGAGVRDTARRAWATREPGATHHLVLQDDAVLCREFRARAVDRVLERPFVPIGFFTSEENPDPVARWFTTPRHLSAVATCLPVAMIDPWLDWWETRHPNTEHDDGALWRWLYEQGIPMWLTSPSLVDHADVPSLLGHRHRAASNFLGT